MSAIVLLFALHPELGILIIANASAHQFKIAETTNSGTLTAALADADQPSAHLEPLGTKTLAHATAQSQPAQVV